MNSVSATVPNVTITITTGAPRGYPRTLVGSLQRAAGWFFLTERYMRSLTDGVIARKALGRREALARIRTRAAWQAHRVAMSAAALDGHGYLDASERRLERLEAEARRQREAAWHAFDRAFVRRAPALTPEQETAE